VVSDLSALLWTGLAAGAIAGAVGGGLGSRVAMRITGIMSSNVERLNRTDNDAIVGDITLGGTLTLVILGAIFGTIGGMFYVALRPYLSKKWPLAGLSFSVLLLAVAGSLIIVGSNRDFRIFGSSTINVLMFALLFPLYGMPLAFLAEKFEGDRGIRLKNWYLQVILLLVLTLLYFAVLIPILVAFITNPGDDTFKRSESGLIIGILGLAGLGILAQGLATNARYAQLLPIITGCLALVGLYFDAQALMEIF
jgi:hypothetical protein